MLLQKQKLCRDSRSNIRPKSIAKPLAGLRKPLDEKLAASKATAVALCKASAVPMPEKTESRGCLAECRNHFCSGFEKPLSTPVLKNRTAHISKATAPAKFNKNIIKDGSLITCGPYLMYFAGENLPIVRSLT